MKSFFEQGKFEAMKLRAVVQAKHGDTFNTIQYKLWADALDVKKHDSMECPRNNMGRNT